MKKKKLLVLIILLIIVVVLVICFSIIRKSDRNNNFQYVTVQMGEIKNTITNTGILHPRSKVEIGTQISGTFSN